jgi:hypothetical protein
VAENRTQGAFAMDEMHGWSLVQIAGWYRSAAAIENTIAYLCGIPPPAEAGGVAVAGPISLIQVGAGRIWRLRWASVALLEVRIEADRAPAPSDWRPPKQPQDSPGDIHRNLCCT